MKKPELVSIRWTKNQPPYNANEICGRSPKDAQILVDQEVAVYIDPPPGLDEKGKALEEPDPPAKKKAAAKKGKAKVKAKGAAKPKADAKPKAKANAKPKGKSKGKP